MSTASSQDGHEGFTFGRERRLRRRTDFLRVQSDGRRVSTRHFVLLVCAREPRAADEAAGKRGAASKDVPQDAPARLGLVVSRKVGNAVHRARVKRLCRECFRTWPGLVPAGVDLVVIARTGASELSRDQVRAEWHEVARQIARRAAEALARTSPPPHVAARRGP